MRTRIISAFPGCGKTTYYNNSNLSVLDSDSSNFSKDDFPENYIKHIKENIGKVDVILVSSHDVVRDALKDAKIFFTLVYPDLSLRNEYIERYKERGSPNVFISLLKKNWRMWINQLSNQRGCKKIVLKSGEYLSDVLK